MEWLLVVWFTVISGAVTVPTQVTTTRVNSKAACESILNQGYNQGLRGLCVYDPASK